MAILEAMLVEGIEGLRVTDMRSRQGVLVNGTRVESAILHAGD